MECSCSISSHMGDAEFDAVLSQEMVISKTTHTCGECGRKIRPGMRYERFVGCFDGTLETYKTCRDCLSLLRNAFFSDWMFNGLWESFRDHMHDCGWQVPEKCLAVLTPAARAKVCELIENHWRSHATHLDISLYPRNIIKS